MPGTTGPLTVAIFTPAGAAATPQLGGTCSTVKRPTVFFSHGYGASDPSDYASLITHWVSIDYDTSQTDLPSTFEEVDSGDVAAVAAEPRIDTSRVGFYGHSHGAGMTPYLTQRADARGWGRNGLWLTSLEQAYTQFEGSGGAITMPAKARAFVVNGDDDQYADDRNGIDVFTSMTLPAAQKQHIMLHSDAHGLPVIDATHTAPMDSASSVDALDYDLWRLSDILETCTLRAVNCSADLGYAGVWSDGVPVARSTVTQHPVDEGPIPALLAECDGTPFAQLDNPRIAACPASRR
jgi:predicted esterase